MRTHGNPTLRGLLGAARSSIETGRFGRMFRALPPGFQPRSSREENQIEIVLDQMARLMISNEFARRVNEGAPTPDADLLTPEVDDENRSLPAGYTYLGQFIDHDITSGWTISRTSSRRRAGTPATKGSPAWTRSSTCSD